MCYLHVHSKKTRHEATTSCRHSKPVENEFVPTFENSLTNTKIPNTFHVVLFCSLFEGPFYFLDLWVCMGSPTQPHNHICSTSKDFSKKTEKTKKKKKTVKTYESDFWVATPQSNRNIFHIKWQGSAKFDIGSTVCNAAHLPSNLKMKVYSV